MPQPKPKNSLRPFTIRPIDGKFALIRLVWNRKADDAGETVGTFPTEQEAEKELRKGIEEQHENNS